MHVTDVTLGVYKQNLNAGLLQQHHLGAGLMAINHCHLLPLNLPKNDVVVIALHFLLIEPKASLSITGKI